MSLFCIMITDVFHIVSILIICKFYLLLKDKAEDRYRYVKAFIFAIIISLVLYSIKQDYIELIIYLICIEIILHICYTESISKLLICGIWVTLIVEIIDMISMSVMNTLHLVLNNHNEILENLLVSVFSLLIIFIVSVLLRSITKNGIKNISIKYLVIFTVILFADLFMLTLMLGVTLEEMAYRNRVLYVISYIAVVIGIFIQLTAVILLLVSRNEHEEKEQIIKEYLEEQVKYYEYLENKEKETKKFRHDIRGHLYFLNKLKNEGNSQKFDEYLQEIIDKVDDLGNNINVGNDIVNAVINKAYTEADKKNIKFKVSGHFPARCNTSTYNLCTIFYNLLNNAIEAADKTEKREVWVICQYTDKEIIVEIGNYFYSKERLDKNKLHTTKCEEDYHGWGIKNVEDSVKDSEGLMDIEIKEDKFIVSLTLNNHL